MNLRTRLTSGAGNRCEKYSRVEDSFRDGYGAEMPPCTIILGGRSFT